MGFDEKKGLDKLQELDAYRMVPSFKMYIGGTEFKAEDLWVRNEDKSFSVIVGRNTGEAEKNKIGLTGDMDLLDGVSRNQFKITVRKISRTESQYFITDLKSANGTFLNAERIPPLEEKLISERDVITIGKASSLIDLDVQFVNGCLVLNQI